MSAAFREWGKAWLDCARRNGAKLPDADQRIEQLLQQWGADVPPGWERRIEDQKRILDTSRRYCRGNRAPDAKRTGEHDIEYQILKPDPTTTGTSCFEAGLVDGVNAVALAKDPGGGRAGNVEADMLLLTRDGTQWRQLLVEVKKNSNDPWYAAVENLRQLKLLLSDETAQSLLRHRNPGRGLPHPIPTRAVVLAPREYYTARGAKATRVAPARRLFERMRQEKGIDAVLAIWDEDTRQIKELREESH